MASKVQSVAESGGKAHIVTVECNITNGLPAVIIVGFANKAVDEAKERLRAAFQAAKINFPKKRITINLAPADIPKDSTGFDLAMAVSIFGASQLVAKLPTKTIYIGELGLDGSIRPVRGIIGKLIATKKKGYRRFFIPRQNLKQARLIPGVQITAFNNLSELYTSLTGTDVIRPEMASNDAVFASDSTESLAVDFIDVSGQDRAKRVLEIAAAGGHNVLLNGPPGTGKSMLAKALVGILPPMTADEVLEVTHLHSLANSDYDRLITDRPFRSPHHSASEISIVGGGTSARPGEISLAHRGVLFLDEIPEYGRSVIESLRQPLEDKIITVARAKHNATYPADFIMVATSNPCPCGYWGTDKNCTCQPHLLINYQRKLSGPIMDRIDLFADVDGISHEELMKEKSGRETSHKVKKRTQLARETQRKRYGSSAKTNANLNNRELKKFARLTNEAETLLNQAAQQLDVSARAYMRIIKVARTIADLENSLDISVAHISEAIQYRRKPVV